MGAMLIVGPVRPGQGSHRGDGSHSLLAGLAVCPPVPEGEGDRLHQRAATPLLRGQLMDSTPILPTFTDFWVRTLNFSAQNRCI